MGKDEAVLVLDHRHAEPQFYRDAGLALTDPLGVTLKQGKDLLVMRDGLAAQDAAADLVDLALGASTLIGNDPPSAKKMDPSPVAEWSALTVSFFFEAEALHQPVLRCIIPAPSSNGGIVMLARANTVDAET